MTWAPAVAILELMILANESYESVAPGDIMEHPKNPRRGDVEAIKASIEANGFFGTIVVQRSSGRIVAGNHRYRAAKELGASKLPVVYVDVDDKTADRMALADNRTSDIGSYDKTMLYEMLQQFEDELPGTGFDDAAFELLMRSVDPDSYNAKEKPPKEKPPKRAALGMIFKLGDHRLMCGNSESDHAVAALLDGAKPHLMVTDPPYGVEYDPEWRNRAGVNDSGRMGVVLNDDQADWRKAWALFPGDVAYIWCASWFIGLVQRSVEACNFEMRSLIIWAKSRFSISRGHYHWKHEPCIYAVRNGGTGHWCGSRTETTLWELESDPMVDVDTNHSTQKPVEAMRRPILNSSKKGDLVYEPFAGSGSTLIAAETCGRKCLAMELNPEYCDIIIDRWERLTGREAVRSAP